MSSKKCKECLEIFSGFTPICKVCTSSKQNQAEAPQNIIGGREYRALAFSGESQVESTDSRRKTKMCKNFPNCRYTDEDCHFLHPDELKTPFSHLRKVCAQFKSEGKCKYGVKCHYSHTLDHPNTRETSIDTHKTTTNLPSFGILLQPAAMEETPQLSP